MTGDGMEENSARSGAHFRLRRRILLRLYEIFQDYPYASVELKQIAEECYTDPGELNWNIVYLEKSGYVELGRSSECPPYIAPSAAITASGIDIVEDAEKFNRRFPDGLAETPDDGS